MAWYYVKAGQQAGPVTDDELEALARNGEIQPASLVWKEGMAQWEAYSKVGPGASSAFGAGSAAPTALAAAPAGATNSEAVCSECGRIFPIEDTIQFGNARVCAGCKPVFMQKLAEGAKIGGGLNYATIGSRFAAVFLDGLLMFAVSFVTGLILGVSSFRGGAAEDRAVLQLVAYAINMSIAAIYETVMIGKYGATLGKMACKVRVITADGGTVGYGRALGRHFAKFLSSIMCLIGYIMAFSDAEKRALHDRICNTRVITVPKT